MKISTGHSVEADEFYITKEDKCYRFVSPMIADWWKNSYDWER